MEMTVLAVSVPFLGFAVGFTLLMLLTHDGFGDEDAED